jgi:hypothetical protein
MAYSGTAFTIENGLGGVVVSVLVTGSKGRGFKPGQDGLLRAIKFRSTPSIGWEVKLQDPYRKILWRVKELCVA